MNEHTKGLLRVGHSGAVVADHPVPEMSGSDAVEYYGGHLVAESVTAANARRLAACWNACDGFTTEELEAHTGPRLLRARLEGAFARIDELLSERNRVGIDISSAILSGIVPDRHPLRSRLELLANHHKRELMLAELLRRARRYVSPLSYPESEIQIVQSIVPSIDSVLAGNLPERKITKPARVWGARFMPGIPEQTIIEAAYRYAEHESSQEEKEAGKINFDLLMAAVHKIAPEGWQLVPVEPTENMIGHGCGASVMVVSEVIKAWAAMLAAAPKPECCRPVAMTDMRFVVCPDCGNKRCPRANDHRNACTGSNELGQEGSAYPAAPKHQGGEPCALESRSSSKD
ncbi:hypothetical protein [Aeromonas hydrophila]|uniref:hypothetical protein n=1 Tax=Aeromonas hydrophila TaxID=644 RepID=UPI0029297093|nr:hypothetical protein [Aeromonas hydrophila]